MQYKLCFFKVGGREKIRRLWHQHYHDVEGVLFVIDSNDQERIEEAREILEGILKAPEMLNVPIVIIANKQDLPSKF
jgi:ADP-ribosylation factor related protein 1